ncbi:hypothetical protein GCM10027088_46080 [Nocardia goodfellowii]
MGAHGVSQTEHVERAQRVDRKEYARTDFGEPLRSFIDRHVPAFGAQRDRRTQARDATTDDARPARSLRHRCLPPLLY